MHWGCDYATAVDVEIDPQRRLFDRRESDFALQRLEECRTLESNPGDDPEFRIFFWDNHFFDLFSNKDSFVCSEFDQRFCRFPDHFLRLAMRRRGSREGASIGGATRPQPWI